MSKKHYAPQFKTFHWLRSEGTIDTKAERVLKLVCLRYKKILVIGNPGAGKNTVANAMFSFMHENGREPLFTPTFSSKDPSSFHTQAAWRPYKTYLTQGHPLIVPFGYETEYYGEQRIPGLFEAARHFDVIVDMRRLPHGERKLCQIFVRRGESFRPIYRDREFSQLQIGVKAA